MSRPPRFIPGNKTLVETITRTVHSRLLLRPSHELNDIVLGILGRAQERGVLVCVYSFLSNNYYIFLVVDSAKQLSGFMGLLQFQPRPRGRPVGPVAGIVLVARYTTGRS
jgi:hypothetical protein